MKKYGLLLCLSISFSFHNTTSFDFASSITAVTAIKLTNENFWKICTLATLGIVVTKDILIPLTRKLRSWQIHSEPKKPKTNLVKILQNNDERRRIFGWFEPRFFSIEKSIKQLEDAIMGLNVKVTERVQNKISDLKINTINPIRVKIESLQRSIDGFDNQHNLPIHANAVLTYELQRNEQNKTIEKRKERPITGYRITDSKSIPLYDDEEEDSESNATNITPIVSDDEGTMSDSDLHDGTGFLLEEHE